MSETPSLLDRIRSQSTSRRVADVFLDAAEREARQHLYTNTKNGNRQAMLNIVERLRAELHGDE